MHIMVGNIPIEANDACIVQVIEAHGGRIEAIAPVMQSFQGGQVRTGRRKITIAKSKEFQPLPRVVRLYGGRFISFRHPGQTDDGDNWRQPKRPSGPRSYATALRTPAHSRDEIDPPDDDGAQDVGVHLDPDTSHFLAESRENTNNTSPRHPGSEPQYHSLPLTLRSQEILRNIQTNLITFTEGPLGDTAQLPAITEGTDDTTTSPEPISVDPPLAPTTDKDWFMSLASHSTDLEWDDTNHDGITGTLTRPLAPITAVDTETAEDTLDDTEAREHPHSLNEAVDITQDDGAPPDPSAAAITISLTTEELGPDYLHQESDSQCLAEGAPQQTDNIPTAQAPSVGSPATTPPPPVAGKVHHKDKKRKKAKSGTESEAGVVPSSSKKLNKPDGHHINLGNFQQHISLDKEKKIRRKVEGYERITHEDVFLDFLLNKGHLNNMLNHLASRSTTEKANMNAYYAYLLFHFIGPMESNWCESVYLQNVNRKILNPWNDINGGNISSLKQENDLFLVMLNDHRRNSDP